jgi:hypothetical protein
MVAITESRLQQFGREFGQRLTPEAYYSAEEQNLGTRAKILLTHLGLGGVMGVSATALLSSAGSVAIPFGIAAGVTAASGAEAIRSGVQQWDAAIKGDVLKTIRMSAKMIVTAGIAGGGLGAAAGALTLMPQNIALGAQMVGLGAAALATAESAIAIPASILMAGARRVRRFAGGLRATR